MELAGKAKPDQYFTATQLERLAKLMSEKRAAEAVGNAVSDELRCELESLVDLELEAALRRIK